MSHKRVLCYAVGGGEGHYIMYTARGVVSELLRISHDDFGFASDGRITSPCNAAVMEYVLCLLGRNTSEEVEMAFLSSMVRPCYYGNGLEPSMGLGLAVSRF